MSVMREVKEIAEELLALTSFLTVIPTGVHRIDLASRGFYLVPLVGLVIALVLLAPLALEINVPVQTCIVVALSYLITGFHNMDGFANFVDAVYGGRSVEDRLRIMKDKHRGTVSVAAVSLLILVYAVSLLSVHDIHYLRSMVALSTISAFESMYVLACISREPPYDGLGRMFVRSSKSSVKTLANDLIYAAVLVALVVLLRINVMCVLAAVATMILCTLFTYYISDKLLGFASGDVLGFNCELSKTCVALTSAALFPLLA